MMSKLNLKTKLLLLCGLLSSVIVVVGVTGLLSLKKVGEEYGFVVSKVAPKINHANQMLIDYRRVRIYITTLAIPGATPSEGEDAVRVAQETMAQYEKNDAAYVNLNFVPGQKELYDKVRGAWLDFRKTSENAISLYLSGSISDKEKMNRVLLKDCNEKAIAYTAAVNELIRFHQSVMQSKAASAQEISEQASVFTLSIVVGGIVFALVCGFIFANTLARSLNRISEAVLGAAEQTSSGGAQLAAASVQLSAGSTEAAASLEETVASLEELSSMVKLNTGNAQEANVLSQRSRESAEKGEISISKLIDSMTDIANGSKKIEEIINVIDDIAFQTNLLALNAAVEAARAGEQGKGFAVVAEAVRGLAQRSALAAKDISTLITENVSKSENGSKVAHESSAVLKDILNAVKKVADLNGEIAAGSQEQASGLEQISKAMNQLDQATQANAASSEEVAASSEEMSHQANALSELVEELQKIVQGAKGDAPASLASSRQGSAKRTGREENKLAAAASFDKQASGRSGIGNLSGF
ncbi:methyl-accepting chemotaxis protein [Bdellovibrio sp. PAP01]|uniref:Methyl-accepting chemotaxis protein n=2 Tax=Bdellovibrio svalbardensis TaxID=2972972 RepID=A0ABT6DJB2_9BACT|nr:methyl-accepting chemotaxis protein [Bdellovibrio svalbardensis]